MSAFRAGSAGILLGIFCLAGSANAVYAQNSFTSSLSGLIDSARIHFPMLLQKQALAKGAQSQVRESRDRFLPHANVADEITVGSDNDLTGQFMPMQGLLHSISGGITGANDYAASTGSLGSFYVDYELSNFGYRRAEIAGARAYASYAESDVTRSVYQLQWEIGTYYFELMKTRALIAVETQNVKRYEAIYSISTALSSTGINAGVDSSLARAELARVRIDYNRQLALAGKLTAELSYLSGVAPEQIRPDSAFRAPRDLPDVDSGSIVNPLADYFDRQHGWYQAQEKIARKAYLPKVVAGIGGFARGSSIQYNNDYQTLSKGFGYQRFNYLAGIGITYDLFNGLHQRDRLATARLQSEAAVQSLNLELKDLERTGRKADQDLAAAMENLQEIPIQQQAATLAYNQKLAQYQAGLIGLIDLTNASYELFQAGYQYITVLSDWYHARLNKAASTGNLTAFIQSLNR